MSYTLFVILPYPSHILAAFDFAKKYNSEGQKVIFTGEIRHKELIEREGFIFEQLDYAAEYKVSNLKVFLAFVIQSILGKGLKVERYKTLYAANLALKELISKYNIQRFFIDEYIADYYFLINGNIEVNLINTRPSTKKVKGVPPLNSLFVPTGTFFSNLITELLWFRHLAKRKVTEIINFIAFWGVDEKFLLNRIAKKNSKNYYREIDNSHCLNSSIKGLLTYNMSPDFFEFPFRKKQPNEKFIFEKIERNESIYITQAYKNLITHINQKKAEGSKIIYVAFGTIINSLRSDVSQFIQVLFELYAGRQNVELVIVSKDLSPTASPSKNIHIYPYISQIDFLNHADLMVNHGGMGSIKECIQAKVKMLTYPLNPKSDTIGNAVRVEALGFGLKGDIKKDSKEDIERKVMQLLSS